MTIQELQLDALIGFLLPLVVAFVQQEHWRNALRTFVGVLACVVASVVTVVIEHKFNSKDLITTLIVIFTLTKTTYLAVWKPSGIAPALEAASSGKVVQSSP